MNLHLTFQCQSKSTGILKKLISCPLHAKYPLSSIPYINCPVNRCTDRPQEIAVMLKCLAPNDRQVQLGQIYTYSALICIYSDMYMYKWALITHWNYIDFLETQTCPVCNLTTPQCEICSGSNCSGSTTTCEDDANLCFFEKCFGLNKITTAGCGMCAGRADKDKGCRNDCKHCYVCCHSCTAAEVESLLDAARSK